MKRRGFTTVLIVAFAIGTYLLLYPAVSDYWNSLHRSAAIASYMEEVAGMKDEAYKKVWAAADEYNARLAKRGNVWVPDEEQLEDYLGQLNVSRTGIIGYIDIPSIDCRLPIYHGTDKAVLQIAIGHIEGSSLPVGGAGTHCVLSGHRGLPGAKLFTDLYKLSAGDIFMLQVLDETLTYEVEKILIVKPYELDALKIEKGSDLCTLVTCTPYRINSHRILVRGRRVETAETAHAVRVTADAVLMEPLLVAVFTALFFLLILWVLWILAANKRRRAAKVRILKSFKRDT